MPKKKKRDLNEKLMEIHLRREALELEAEQMQWQHNKMELARIKRSEKAARLVQKRYKHNPFIV